MMCRAFSITLSGSGRSWYRHLKAKSISSFAELSKLFLTQFISGKKSRKPTTHLFTLKQGNKESLKDFITRFNEEALLVEDYDDKMALSTMSSGLREGKLIFLIGKNSPTTLAELINRAQKYTNAEEFSNSRRNIQAAEQSSKEKRPRNKDLQSSNQRDKRKYCRFHRDHCHNTSDRIDLKDEIETLIRNGHLRRYTRKEKSVQREEQQNKTAEEPAEIRTIYGNSFGGGDSNRARKAYSQSSDPEHYVHLVEKSRKEPQANSCSLTFTEDDAREIQHPHDDALVVAMTITNHKVYRILVDTGSSIDVIYSEAFERMRIDRSSLRPVKTPLHGFVGDQQTLTVNVLDFKAPAEDSSMEELVTVALEEADPSRTGLLGSSLNFEQRSQILAFSQKHKDIFTWSHEDMPGISPDVMVYKLNVNPDHRLVKQKRRAFNAESFPLPRIDLLEDSTAGHEQLSFLDAYSGYNQIAIHPSDRQKATFVTDKGLYYYRVIPLT
ncbi:uncharacterized protein LOC131217612 [Magnolia sinica]|uniref:uncharacterized protein LOC131217612 n=1 Tax=Magnolia sinica TaxID=86752 RepID=UPI002659CF1B|nr:uncharacterized protein LOC131217612 [Magnolia sinica]